VIFGTDFEDAFKASLVNDLAAQLAKDIGRTWGSGKNPAAQTLAHIGLGAATAELTGKDAASGAIGGLVESVLDNTYGQTHTKDVDRTLYAAGSALTAGLAADLLGKDPATAANVARNAAENNYLNTLEKKRRDELRAKAEAGRASIAERAELVALEQKDQSSDALLWRLRELPESLSERDKAALAIDLVNYAKVERQQGLSEQQVQNKITALLDGRMPTEYVFPYASGDKAYQDYYIQKLKEAGGWNDTFSMDYLFGGRRIVPAAEETYRNALGVLQINNYHEFWAQAGTPALRAPPNSNKH
jgi:hypothetical protein